MPVIDLKNTTIYFEDGTSKAGLVNNATKTGAVNNALGYAAGATTIIVDGFTGAVQVGAQLTINAVTGYRVTAHSETTGNTTSITFTPGLTGSVADDAVVSSTGFAIGATRVVVDGFTGVLPVGARVRIGATDKYVIGSTTESGGNTIVINFTPALVAVVADNAGVDVFGVFLQIKVGDGTITWSEKKPREYKKDRGKLDQVRDGDEEPIDVTINLMYEELTASSGNPPTPEDVLKQRGEAADWVSTETDDPCAPFAINVRLDHQPPNCTSVQAERVVLPRFRYESLDHNPKDGMINCQGKCNATEAEVTRYTVV
jgi:hypothetical protein